jgi:biopolymer transport protein ExbD
MASRGFLIRFIDIGLIVLFGFLMISDIESLSRVDLAGAQQQEIDEPAEDPDERAFIIVEVAPDGRFGISDPAAPEAGFVVAANAESLTQELRARRDANDAAALETIVLIQPDLASAVQFTVDAMDVCDRLSIAKSLRMDIEIEAVSPPRSGAP